MSHPSRARRFARFFGPAPLAVIALAACSSTTTTPQTGVPLPSGAVPPTTAALSPHVYVAYPQDDTLRVNHIQAKGTHNSYHVERPGNDQPEWQFTERPLDEQLGALGVRQIELDINFRADESGFDVFHIEIFDAVSNCYKFEDCLLTIGKWSEAHPGHQPIYVQLEPKAVFYPDKADAYFKTLEQAILNVFPLDRLLTPDSVRGSAKTLGEAIADHGWPTLREARGKVFFGFDNTGDVRAAYLRNNTLDGRLIFVDGDTSDPFGAFMVANDPTDLTKINRGLDGHFLVRTRADEDANQARATDYTMQKAALASNATWISTDFPEPSKLGPYSFDIPGGTPSRCNARTAPASCTPLDIEDPTKLTAP